MFEDFLINELADSDEDVGVEVNMLFDDIHSSETLFRVLGTRFTQGLSKPQPKEDFVERSVSKVTALNNNSYIKNILSYSEDEFLRQFRVKRSLADSLIDSIAAESANHPDQAQLHHIPADVQILSVLCFLGQEKSTFEDICEKFSFDAATFGQILHKVTGYLNGLSSEVIGFSHQNEEQCFSSLSKTFRGLIGCVGTLPIRVTIEKCEENSETFKKQVLFIVQCAVDEDAYFTNVYVSEAAFQDVDIFVNSPLYSRLPVLCSGGQYLVGGPSYPCLRNLITPYPEDCGDLTGSQIYFNFCLSSALKTVKTAFSLLTHRFGKLRNLSLPDPDIASQLISACCVLHNMASNDDFEAINESPAAAALENEGHVRIETQQTKDLPAHEGLKLRDDLCEELLQESK